MNEKKTTKSTDAAKALQDARADAVTPQEVPALADRQVRPGEQHDTDALVAEVRADRSPKEGDALKYHGQAMRLAAALEQARAERDDAREEALAMRHDRDLAFAERDQARAAADEWATSHRAGAPAGTASAGPADAQPGPAAMCSYDHRQPCTCAGRTTKCPALPLEVDADAEPKPASPENERFNRSLADAKERREHATERQRLLAEQAHLERVIAASTNRTPGDRSLEAGLEEVRLRLADLASADDRGPDDRREAMAVAGNRDDVPTERGQHPRWNEE